MSEIDQSPSHSVVDESDRSTSYPAEYETDESTISSARSEPDEAEPTGPVTDPNIITIPSRSPALFVLFAENKTKAKDDNLNPSFHRQEFYDTVRQVLSHLHGGTNSVIDKDVETLSPSAGSDSAGDEVPFDSFVTHMKHRTRYFGYAMEGTFPDDNDTSSREPRFSQDGMFYLVNLHNEFSEFRYREGAPRLASETAADPASQTTADLASETAAEELEEAIFRLCGNDLNDKARENLQLKQEELTRRFPAEQPTQDTSNQGQLTALGPGSLVALSIIGRMMKAKEKKETE